jgi:hypothetical protein
MSFDDFLTQRRTILSATGIVGGLFLTTSTDPTSCESQVTDLQSQLDAANAQIAALQAQLASKQQSSAAAPMVFGVSNSASVWDYVTRQTTELKARAMYQYGQTTTLWGKLATVPDSHDIWFQSLTTSASGADSLIASMPDTRTGKVYLHFKNEPEDNMSAAAYVAGAKVLYDAVDRARAKGRDLSYIVKAAELNGYQLIKGTDERPFVPAGCQCVGWSVYGGQKVVNGHADWAVSPQQWVDTISTAMQDIKLPFSVAAGGLPLTAAQLNDSVSRQNRVNGMVTLAENFKNLGARHFMWYDRVMPDTSKPNDFLFAHDRDLTNAWVGCVDAALQPATT